MEMVPISTALFQGQKGEHTPPLSIKHAVQSPQRPGDGQDDHRPAQPMPTVLTLMKLGACYPSLAQCPHFQLTLSPRLDSSHSDRSLQGRLELSLYNHRPSAVQNRYT